MDECVIGVEFGVSRAAQVENETAYGVRKAEAVTEVPRGVLGLRRPVMP